MIDEKSKLYTSEVSTYSRFVTFFCLVFPLVVFSGWALDIEAFITWNMVGPGMNPFTAILFLFSGLILFLFSTGNRRLVAVFSWIMLLIVLIIFITSFTEYPLDRLLFSEKLSRFYKGNSMAYSTMFTFAALSIAYSGYVNARYKISQLLCLSVFFLSLIVFITYIFGDKPFFILSSRTPMALNTSLSVLLLSSASTLLFPNRGFARHIAGKSTGSRLSKIFIPAAFIFVIVMGVLRVEFFQDEENTIEIGLAFTVAITIMVFLVVIYCFSFQINFSEFNLEKEKHVVSNLNRKLHEKNRELTLKNQELEHFVQSVTHDIRSPLSGIINISGKLIDDKKSFNEAEMNEFLHLIKTTSESVMDRTTQLLELAKAARKPIRKAHVNSAYVVEQVLKVVQAGYLNKKIDLQVKGLPVVMADKALLHSVFYNLISNAVKYSDGDVAKIIVSCQQKGREKIFSVRDYGIGLDMDSISQLFKPYARLVESHNVSGSGLGLWIVKRIIERHGGKVWAKPGEDKGAIFYFSLPS